MSGLEDLGPMPEGWSLKWHGVGNTRRPYFINHQTRQTTWDDPRKQRSRNATPSQSRATPSQSPTTPKQRESAKATLSDEEIMAKAIALSMAEEEQRKKQASSSSSRPKPTPSQSNRPTMETASNDDENADSNFADFSSVAFSPNSDSSPTAAADADVDANVNVNEPTYQNQNEARAKGPNPALTKGPNPDLLLSARAEAKGPDPSLCQGPMGLAKGPQARAQVLAA